MNSDRIPDNLRIAFNDYERYRAAARRGRLFFWRGRGVCSKVNELYQRRMRGGKVRQHWDHVGVIGDADGAYESTLFAGPSRNRSMRRYLQAPGTLMIGEVAPRGHALRPDDIDRGMSALIRRIQEVHDTARGLLTYDWVSLVTLGVLQLNNRLICSELATLYLNEALRLRPNDWDLRGDQLILPDDLEQFVVPVWVG